MRMQALQEGEPLSENVGFPVPISANCRLTSFEARRGAASRVGSLHCWDWVREAEPKSISEKSEGEPAAASQPTGESCGLFTNAGYMSPVEKMK